MEELRKLEKVQSMLEFMESKGLVTPSSHSNRFVANLMLFLLEPCGEVLGMDEKCCLVSNLIPSLSSAFLDEASLWLSQDLLPKQENSGNLSCRTISRCLLLRLGLIFVYWVEVGFQQNVVRNALVSCNRMEECSLQQSYNKNMAMVGLDCMQKANSSLEDFVEELHMEFLSISEFLVEVSDDLYDYEDDVFHNNFNILRMFVRIYGASTAPSMLAMCISEAENKYKTLLESLDPQLSLSYQKRCEEATKEGGKISEHPLGAWTIPTVIPDEEMYRSKLMSDTS
ncbi:hypothetical protein RIF29_30022 [Crotalaria pallida]|uniref:Uncharacterized protein n=1 Tax=Crotalaria pallida TaxID=3830 RepID=A0AAN9HUE3_CROPI